MGPEIAKDLLVFLILPIKLGKTGFLVPSSSVGVLLDFELLGLPLMREPSLGSNFSFFFRFFSSTCSFGVHLKKQKKIKPR